MRLKNSLGYNKWNFSKKRKRIKYLWSRKNNKMKKKDKKKWNKWNFRKQKKMNSKNKKKINQYK